MNCLVAYCTSMNHKQEVGGNITVLAASRREANNQLLCLWTRNREKSNIEEMTGSRVVGDWTAGAKYCGDGESEVKSTETHYCLESTATNYILLEPEDNQPQSGIRRISLVENPCATAVTRPFTQCTAMMTFNYPYCCLSNAVFYRCFQYNVWERCLCNTGLRV